VSDIVLKGYVQLRRGILTHLNERRLTLNEFVVFNILLMLADKETGSYKTNALAIQFWTGGQLSEDGADRALRSLEKKGYIVREITPGQYGVYPYHIQKFVVTSGAEVGKVLTFKKKRNGVEETEELLAYFGAEPAEEGAKGTADVGAEVPAVPPADKTRLETGDLKQETKAKVGSKSDSQVAPTPLGFTSESQDLQTLFQKEPNSVQLLFDGLYPNGFESVALFLKEVPHARACVEILAKEKIDVRELLKYNRTHKSGGLVFRSCAQLLKALTTDEQRTLNDFVGHESSSCRTCRALTKKGASA
jgi:hypothetical protein